MSIGEPALALTLSETQALCAKAVRGAGYPWGLADEAGRAAAWLAARGLPGAALILGWATGPALSAPVPAVGDWSGAGPLCPIRAGIALADHACLPEGPTGAVLRLDRMAWPGLLLPFVATSARIAGTGLALRTAGHELFLGTAGTLAGPTLPLCDMAMADVLIAPSEVQHVVASEAALPMVPAKVWQALEQLALGSTVPPSATSRSGAGASGSDND